MRTRFFTNDGENTLLNKFKGVFEHNKHNECFDILDPEYISKNINQ